MNDEGQVMTEMQKAERDQFEVKEEWLESVERCPVCGNASRKPIASGLRDINYGGVSGAWDFKQCLECRSVYMDPRIDKEHISSAYARYETHTVSKPNSEKKGLSGFFQRMGDAYAWKKYGLPGRDHSLGKALLAYLFPSIRLERDFLCRHADSRMHPRSVLDVGCGNGDFLKRMKDAGWITRGVDFDPAAVAVARARGLDVELGSVDQMDGAEHGFDLVTASHVIEHVHEPELFLKQLYMQVRPGGVLWIATPNIDSPLRRIEGEFWNNWETPRHLQMFNQMSLKAMLERSLGEMLGVTFKRRGWHVYWSMAQSAFLRKGMQRATRPRLAVRRLPVALILELAALISPRFGDELVVEIHKNWTKVS
jgi:2-polyprenyl-3-methyl-5-hydroxy-6-metoxy-1,4-benzoquinol methylase